MIRLIKATSLCRIYTFDSRHVWAPDATSDFVEDVALLIEDGARTGFFLSLITAYNGQHIAILKPNVAILEPPQLYAARAGSRSVEFKCNDGELLIRAITADNKQAVVCLDDTHTRQLYDFLRERLIDSAPPSQSEPVPPASSQDEPQPPPS